MTKFKFQGTGETTGGGSVPVAEILVVVVLAGVAYGVFEAVAAVAEDAMFAILVAVAGVIAGLVLGTAWALVYRVRHGEAPWAPLRRRFLPEPVLRELPGPERPAIPRHVHFHFDGADPGAVAEIIRRSQRPEH